MSSAWIEILQEAQKGLAYHKSGIKKLMEILKEESLESKQLLQFIFSNGFCNVMLVQKKDPSVERLSKFLIDLSICGIEWVLNMTISFLLEMSTASDKTIRTKSCLFISQIFSNMSLEAEIPDSLWESTISTLVSRLHDKIPAVRMWAIRALGRLQNPDDENDVVVSEILRLMKTDDSSQVRVAATETICVSKYSLIELVKRVKDIDPHVRSAALIHLTKDVDVRHYNSYMRNLIVGYGLQDRDETVKKTTINLIESWLKQIDYRVPKLLHMLNIMNNSKEIELFAWQLIDMIEKGQISNQDLKENLHKSSESWEGPFQSLGLSDLLWTKLRCDYGRENMPPFAGNNLINELLPPVILLCRQIEQGSRQSLEDNEAMLLTMKYLLGLTKFMRSSEEGYLQIGIVCDRLLRDIHFPMDLIDDTLAAWAGKPGDHSKVLEALHLAFDLRSQYQMACSEDNNEGNMEEQEALAFIRSLQIIQWCLQSAVEHFSGRSFQITAVFGDHLDGIIHDVVLALQQPVMELRCLAVKCVGLLGLCDSMLAESNLALIFQVASNDLEEPEIRCQALEVLCDFVLIYQQAWKHQINLVGLLVRLQEHGDAEVARVAADVSAKLLYSGVIEDVSLLAILLKFFFLSEVLQSADDDAQDRDYDPRGQLFDIGDKYRLQQILSLFFQTYFSVIKSSQASLIQAIPIFVSDISMLIRDGDIPSGLLEKVIVVHGRYIYERIKIILFIE